MLSGDEHVAEYRPPRNVVPIEPGEDLGRDAGQGELAAVVGVDIDSPDVAPLIPDPEEAGFAALQSRGHYPINHLVVVKDERARGSDPRSVWRCSTPSPGPSSATSSDYETVPSKSPTATDRMYQKVMDLTGADPLPYGIEPNREYSRNSCATR